MHNALSLRSVVAVARAYRKLRSEVGYLSAKTTVELTKMERATAASLAALSRGGLAPDVRLSKSKVEQMLWALYKSVKAQRQEAAVWEAELAEERRFLVLSLDRADAALCTLETGSDEYFEWSADRRYYEERLAQLPSTPWS
jgi:hypothetical protein